MGALILVEADPAPEARVDGAPPPTPIPTPPPDPTRVPSGAVGNSAPPVDIPRRPRSPPPGTTPSSRVPREVEGGEDDDNKTTAPGDARRGGKRLFSPPMGSVAGAESERLFGEDRRPAAADEDDGDEAEADKAFTAVVVAVVLVEAFDMEAGELLRIVSPAVPRGTPDDNEDEGLGNGMAGGIKAIPP